MKSSGRIVLAARMKSREDSRNERKDINRYGRGGTPGEILRDSATTTYRGFISRSVSLILVLSFASRVKNGCTGMKCQKNSGA